MGKVILDICVKDKVPFYYDNVYISMCSLHVKIKYSFYTYIH